VTTKFDYIPAIYKVQIVNKSKNLKKDQLEKVVKAINKQLERDFYSAWALIAKCSIAPVSRSVDDFDRGGVIFLVDQVSDDALGYHDVIKKNGVAYGYVFLDVSKELDENWSVTLSHEVLELVLNKHVNQYALGKHPKESRMVFHWFEACDAVQDQSYAIDRVRVSDFVHPAWFTPYSEVNLRNNQLDNVKSFSLADGGYQGFYDPAHGRDDNYFADSRAMARYDIKAQLDLNRRRMRALDFTKGISYDSEDSFSIGWRDSGLSVGENNFGNRKK